MGAEVAVRSGIGTLVLDARRDGSEEAKGYTFPALVATQKLIRREPGRRAAAVRAVMNAQRALKEDPERATAVGRKLFPPTEASLIAELIRRDLPVLRPRDLEEDGGLDEPLRAGPRHALSRRCTTRRWCGHG
jgi:ABC-type nitrate/sulfonate/bicarbonate transport system substrate-binding protein